jgi:putative sterol carrier protein
MPDQLNDVHLDVVLRGLGAVIVETHVRNVDIRARQRLYATPVDETHIDIRGIVHVNETDDPVFTEELADLFYRAYVEDFAKDFPIWENKRYLVRPTLAKGDGPVGVYRRWCTQFYDEPMAVTVGDAHEDDPARAQPQAHTRAQPRVDVPLTNGHAPLLRKLSGRVSAIMPERVRGTAELVVAQARERVPWLASVLGPSVESSGHAGQGGYDQTHADEGDDWTPGDGGADPYASATTASSRSSEAPLGGGVRVASAQEYFETLAQRFVPSAGKGVEAVYQWELGGAAARTFHAIVRDGELEIHDGPHPRPTVALAMDADDYVKVVNGDMDGMRAFTSGKGKVKGSVRAAMKMRSLFPAA